MRPAGTTSTPPRPGNHPAAGGDQAPRPSASPPARPSTASRTRAIPQDHVHNQIARITRTFSDGKWRALDTMSVRAVLGALQAVAATAVECELTREFGVTWIPRADGRGNEIRGMTQAQMDAYSTRTVQVREKERELAQAWARKHGRAPTSRELLHIANAATLQSRKGKGAGAIDWDALATRWDATLGVVRYATTAQLSMEERLVAHAQTHGAPHVRGELAVPHPARRRTGRPGPWRGHPDRHHRPGPGRDPGRHHLPSAGEPNTSNSAPGTSRLSTYVGLWCLWSVGDLGASSSDWSGARSERHGGSPPPVQAAFATPARGRPVASSRPRFPAGSRGREG